MNIYEQLGLKKIINAWGTVTRIGGSKLDSDIIEAMREASQSRLKIRKLFLTLNHYRFL